MDNELDEGMVEKARAAFEAMTKAMLDAGRRCDHDHDDGLGMLTARDIPTAAGVPALLAEVERLRAEVAAGIETVARDLRSLLAGSGEQPGEHVHRTSGIDDAEDCPDILGGAAHCSNPQEADDGQWEDLTRPAPVGEQPGECDRSGEWCRTHREAWPCLAGLMAGMLTTVDAASPAPVVPDSPDVYETIRAFIEEEVGFDGGPGMDDQARRLTDRVLAVVGQGVTAGERRYSAGDPDPTPDGSETLCEAQRDGFVCTWPTDHDHPQHVAGAGDEIAAVWDVRPTGQEQADG